MLVPPSTLLTRKSPPILLAADGTPIVAFGSPKLTLEADPAAPTSRFTALGYRQTEKPAAKGGEAKNANGFRFRHKAMRAIARTFRGGPFISGHDWGDVRARGGTLLDSWADTPADVAADQDELGFFYTVELKAQWALEALRDGLISMFSIGASGRGEITCTVHDAPVWTDCYCWPLRVVDGLVAEWEYEDAVGKELSAVNVPAVEGTSIVEVHAGAREPADLGPEALAALAAVCGRVIPQQLQRTTVDLGARPTGGFRAPPAPITMTPDERPTGSTLMDLKALAKMLGLPETATEDQVKAALKAATNAGLELGHLRAEVDQQHVETAIAALQASHSVNDATISSLRAEFEQGGRAAFDKQLAFAKNAASPVAPAQPAQPVTAAPTAAPKPPIAAPQRPQLQTDAPAADPLMAQAEDNLDGPDCYEQSKGSPIALRFFRWAGLTAENVKTHGPRALIVQPDLRAIIEQSAT